MKWHDVTSNSNFARKRPVKRQSVIWVNLFIKCTNTCPQTWLPLALSMTLCLNSARTEIDRWFRSSTYSSTSKSFCTVETRV